LVIDDLHSPCLRRKGPVSKGEALPTIVKGRAEVLGEHAMCTQPSEDRPRPLWYALYTRSRCEQLVCEQLAAKGFHIFLPKIAVWSQRAGERHLISIPMFSGYLFLRHAIDKSSYIEVRKARGLVRILGERWDKLSVVPDADIEAIQTTLHAAIRVMPHPYLREGQRVRITQGPLQGVEGILVQSKPAKGLLILSIDLLQRSISVEIDCRMVSVPKT
jgi:transcription termination/antitermination protein NusG